MIARQVKLLAVSIVLFAVLGSAYWKVPLQNMKFYENPTATPAQKYADDIVYYKEIYYGGVGKEKVYNTVFDVTSKNNWLLTLQCTNDANCLQIDDQKDPSKFECNDPCVLDQTSSAHPNPFTPAAGDPFGNFFEGRLNFTKYYTGVNRLQVPQGAATDRLTFKDVKFFYPSGFVAGSDTNLLKHDFRAGFGLGATDNYYGSTNFLDNIAANERIERTGFSFYLHDIFPMILFGGEQGYFRTKPFRHYKNRARVNLLDSEKYATQANIATLAPIVENQWRLKITKITFKKAQTDVAIPTYQVGTFNAATNPPVTPNTVDAEFDTTTMFMWGQAELITNIYTKLNDIMQNNCVPSPTANTGLYECECSKDSANFPSIFITFENDSEAFELKGSQYTYIYDNSFLPGTKNCLLLFRQPTGLPAAQVPQVTNKLILGTSFLKAHYTYFNQQKGEISMAPSFNVEIQNKLIQNTHRYVFIVVGVLLFAAGLIALLTIIPKVPYVPQQAIPATHFSQQVVQQPPQQLIQIQQPSLSLVGQLVQTPPKTSNYIIQQQPVVSQSTYYQQPQPVYQTYAPSSNLPYQFK